MKKVLVAACLLITSHGFGLAQSTITIGDTNIEAAADGDKGSLLLAQQVTLSQTATIHTLSFYVMAAHRELRLGIYDASGPGGAPGVRKAQTQSFAPQVGWNTHRVITPVSLAPGNYWLAYLPSSNKLGFVKQNNSGNCWYIQSYSNQVLPHTFPSNPSSCNPTTWSFYATLKIDAPVNGQCGSANGKAVSSAPTSGLCSLGTASAVTGTGPWYWSCAGSNGGTTASCSAPFSPAPINGQCGPANGVAASTAPTTGLCSVGLASSVTGTGPWNWSCAGSNGGTTASCGTTSTQTSGIIPSDRDASANWRMAGMLSVGGIPARTTVCATVNPLGGGQDDTARIQSAIDSCPVGQVVMLSVGTFTVSEGSTIQLSRAVTLRGNGPTTTILNRPNGATLGSYFPGSNPSPVINISGNGATGSAVALSADAAQGSYSVQVASAAGFAVGQIVLLDEASGAGWQPDIVWTNRQIWASPDYRVVWQKHNPYYQFVDDFDSSTFPYTVGSAGCWFSNCDRPTNEMHQIKAISANTITFDSPVMISYRVSHTAHLTPAISGPTNAGVENLAVKGGDAGNINFDTAAYAWVKNVDNSLYLNSGFNINSSFRVQLEHVYIHNAAWPVNGGAGYNISLAWGSSEVLIEDSISVLANKVMVDRSAGAGSVVAYNYMDDGYINGQDGWVEIGINGSHMVGGHHVLFEGNQSFNSDSDQTHGNSIYHTFFRNWLTGYRKPFSALDGTHIDDTAGCCSPLRAAGAHAYAYWFSWVGNVLGTPGKMSGWAYDGLSGNNSFPPTAIWTLGDMDISPQGYDPNVEAKAIRDGNYDFLTNSQHWHNTPGKFAMPNSLYLTSKPAFFGSNPWPWTDPTTGTISTLPAKARYDAGTPNNP
jgi:hypothetical protein